MNKISTKQKITLIISGLVLCIVLLELGLRIEGFVFLRLQEHKNIISIRQKGTYRIMCLGESTTAMGGKDSYPHQLEEILNQRDIGIKFSVINKGIPAINTTAIVSQLEANLSKYNPDMVITMMGINDKRNNLAYKDIDAKEITPFFKSLRICKLVKLLRLHIINKAQELGIYKSKEKKEDISARTNDLKQPINFKEQDKIVKNIKAIEINPENDSAYFRLGLCYRNQGKLDKAKEMFRKATEINPENYWAYFRLGQCWDDQGKYGEAEKMFKEAIDINPKNDEAYITVELYPKNHRLHGLLAYCYKKQGKEKLAEECLRKTNKLRLEYYNPITRHNYQRLKEILTKREIKLVCVQYPVRNVEPLKKIFNNKEGIIFVDNEEMFKKALRQASFDEYFSDMFGGDFGHCTAKGNRLLAENIANVILKECLKK